MSGKIIAAANPVQVVLIAESHFEPPTFDKISKMLNDLCIFMRLFNLKLIFRRLNLD